MSDSAESVDGIRRHAAGAMRLKLIGNEQLKTANFQSARDTYVEALRFVLQAVDALKETVQVHESELKTDSKLAHDLDAVKSEIEEIRLQLISNLSLTEIKLELWAEAQSHAAMVLAADPLNLKALFRRSVARIRLNEQLELALADLQKVAERDRSNADVHAEIALCRSALKLQKKRDDEFRSAFRGSMKQEPTSFLTNVSESINGILCNVLGKDAFSLLGQCGGLRPSSKRPSHNN